MNDIAEQIRTLYKNKIKEQKRIDSEIELLKIDRIQNELNYTKKFDEIIGYNK